MQQMSPLQHSSHTSENQIVKFVLFCISLYSIVIFVIIWKYGVRHPIEAARCHAVNVSFEKRAHPLVHFAVNGSLILHRKNTNYMR